MTKIDTKQIEEYMTWLRNIQMYPPSYSPEEYADWIDKVQAQAKIALIHATVFDTKGLTITEIYDKIVDILNTNLEVDVL